MKIIFTERELFIKYIFLIIILELLCFSVLFFAIVLTINKIENNKGLFEIKDIPYEPLFQGYFGDYNKDITINGNLCKEVTCECAKDLESPVRCLNICYRCGSEEKEE